MNNTNLKIGIFFMLLLFLLIGAVSANDDINDTLSTDSTTNEITGETDVSSANDTTTVNEDDTKTTPTPVLKKQTKIKGKPVSGKQGKKVKLTAFVKQTDGKAIKNSKVTFKFSGKTYKTKTDKNGKASITVKLPKAKYFKTIKSKKGSILTVKKVFKTIRTCTVQFAGSKTYKASSTSFKVTSNKKSIVKKYRHKNYRYVTVPFKSGQHQYNRGSIAVITNDAVEEDTHGIIIAAGNKKTRTIIPISTKLHSKYPNGKWYWDNTWEESSDYNGVQMVVYYYNMDPVNKIKIRYKSPHYERIR